MKKTSKKKKSPATAPKRKVAIKDLKAKNAGSVKGGVLLPSSTIAATDQDHKDWFGTLHK